MTIETKCAKCGAGVKLDDKWKAFAEKYPERVTCQKCKNAGGKSATKATKKAIEDKKEPSCTCCDNPASATKFKEVYHQFKEVFGEEMAEVKDYIGGWVSTVIIQGTKKK